MSEILEEYRVPVVIGLIALLFWLGSAPDRRRRRAERRDAPGDGGALLMTALGVAIYSQLVPFPSREALHWFVIVLGLAGLLNTAARCEALLRRLTQDSQRIARNTHPWRSPPGEPIPLEDSEGPVEE